MYPTNRALNLLALFLAIGISASALAQETADDENSKPEVEIQATEAEETKPSSDASASALNIEEVTRDRVLGEEDAPLTIIEYASFTCPHCITFEQTVWPKIQEEYIETGKAKFIYREVYFDGAGLFAASLARCVPEEQYYPMVFTLYENSENWLASQSDVKGIIGELSKLGIMAGLSKDDIGACLDDRNAQEAMIANSQKNMEKDNVRGTPTLIVNGETVKNWQWDNLEPFLEEQYEKATK